MSPMVFDAFGEILARHFGENGRPARAALEIGAGNHTLLSHAPFNHARRVAVNMLTFDAPSEELQRCELVVANSNERLPFPDASFDCIMSCSVLEHDRYFWKSTAEIRRLLRPGGLFVVGVPIYMTLPTDADNTTATFRRHGLAYNADYYRFSEQCVREVVLDELTVEAEVVVRRFPNPYMVAAGAKRAA
jgi:SAM-dependent methyltransferase